ncbi:MAG: radical SAM protein [Isosphaerales bacterium]
MTVELRPLGVACNLACTYCYQNPIREAGNVRARYDIEVMKQAVQKEGGPFALFGGEPLLLPLDDLEALLAWGFEMYGGSGLQTNGVLIQDEHIDLFIRYKVGVGVSIDGPDELNDYRWAGSLERTREQTARSEATIHRLLASGLSPTVIVTLHRANASRERLSRLCDWIAGLDVAGVRFLRLHLLEVESPAVRECSALSIDENLEVLMTMAELQGRLLHLRFDLFGETESLLAGQDESVSCVWRACDPLTTPAVRGIEGDGQRSNCSRTNKLGIDFVKADAPTYERYLALYHTPYECGGCAGCRFFLFCKGQCPGTAIDGDWRNRSEDCRVWFGLFEEAERKLLARGFSPLSAHPVRVKLEKAMLAAWATGQNPSLKSLLEQVT